MWEVIENLLDVLGFVLFVTGEGLHSHNDDRKLYFSFAFLLMFAGVLLVFGFRTLAHFWDYV